MGCENGVITDLYVDVAEIHENRAIAIGSTFEPRGQHHLPTDVLR